MQQIGSALDAEAYPARPYPRHFNLWTWVRAQVDKATYRPRATPGVIVRELTEDGTTYYVLKNPRLGTYLKLGAKDHALWGLMDGSRTVKDLVVAYFERYKAFAFGRVTALVDELRAEGFLTDKPVGVYRQAAQQLAERDWSHRWGRLAHTFLEQEFYVKGVDRYVTLAYRLGGRVLFFKPVLAALTVLALIGFVAFVWLLGQGTYAILAPDDSTVLGYIAGLLALLLINMVMIFIHESAHALTTKHFGREVRRGGAMIYYGMPAFFVDTVDIWLEPKRRRVAVSWAGPHSELIVAGLCSLLAMGIADPASLAGALLFKAAFLGYFSVFVNLNPLLELDGYFILSDWLGIPMLRQRSFAFIREELPGKALAWVRPRLRSETGFLERNPVSEEQEGQQRRGTFTREEIIFTIFGGLAALYTAYVLVIAVYFWQTRISKVLLDLWSKDPALIFKPLVALLVTLVIVPVTLTLGATLWNSGRRLAGWLERRHFFERESNVALGVAMGLALMLMAPLLVGGTARLATLVGASILLAGLAVWTLVLTARQYAGAEFQATFWGLIVSAGLLLIGAFLRGLYLVLASGLLHRLAVDTALVVQQLAAVGLLLAGVRSLVRVNLARGPTWERVTIAGLLALGFVIVLPVARWTAGWRLVEAIPAVASAYFTLVFLALILPTLTAYVRTHFFIPWTTLVLGASVLGVLNIARTAPAWPAEATGDAWLELATAALWGIGGLIYVTAGGRLYFPGPHWSHAVTLSEEERLQVAFAHFFPTLFEGFRITFGARRAQAVDDELDVISVTANWDVEIDAGRVHDELDLSQMSILQQADRYREVLAKTMDLMDDWAGSLLTARMAQAAYDSLPWPERETLGRYVLAGTAWGGTIADQFASAWGERDRLLRAVPFLAGLSNRAFYLLQAALRHEKVPAGRILARRGTPIRRFVLIQSGKIEIWQPDLASGRERLAGELQRGGTFGFEVWVGGGSHRATYRASIDIEILTISAAEAAHLRRAGVEIDTHVAGTLSATQLLSQMPIFAHLSPQQIDALAGHMERLHVDAGQVIVRQGEPRHHFYVILEGEVTTSVRDKAGNGEMPGDEVVVARLGRGEHFGETALYTDQPYSATYRAESRVELLALDEPTFDQLVASSTRMAHYVEQVSSGRTLDTRRKLGLKAVVS
jgi:putative peptide zinc metalloprotease protein